MAKGKEGLSEKIRKQFTDREFVSVREAMGAVGFDDSQQLSDYARTLRVFQDTFGLPEATFDDCKPIADGFDKGMKLK